MRVSKLLANLCCTPIGKKNSGSIKKTLARGFSTSPRLAIWINLNTFLQIQWLTSKILKGHDPRIVIFIDDIGITASRISKQKMKQLQHGIEKILQKNKTPQNRKKTLIKLFSNTVEHLGVVLGRNKVTIGSKTRKKLTFLLKKIKKSTHTNKQKLLKKKHAYYRYKNQLKNSTYNK